MAINATGTPAASSYIDIDALTSVDFSPYSHANILVLASNNPTDPTIDLNAPLSRALFDLQEIDTNIHTLTSRSAIDILTYTAQQNVAAQRILARVEEERVRLNASYARLEAEVLGRYDGAIQAKLVAERTWELLQLNRSISRILNIAKQFETVLAESGLGSGRVGKEDHRSLLRATLIILSFREAISSEESQKITQVNLVKTIRGRVFEDGEARILDFARRVVREFSMSSLTNPGASNSNFRDTEENRARFTNAVHILYLLSPAPYVDGDKMQKSDFEPEYLIRALQGYLQSAVTSSSAGIGRSLGQLPTLDKTLLEVSARCQNVIALEMLLRQIKPPSNPLLRDLPKSEDKARVNVPRDSDEDEDEQIVGPGIPQESLLDLLLHSLDTASLASYFWRSLASSLSSRVLEILTRGGVAARTLKSQQDRVKTEIRECVLRGSRLPAAIVTSDDRAKDQIVSNWEREAAVMVSSIVGVLGR